MPIELQELSPKPDFEAIDSAAARIPKLAVRGRTDPLSQSISSITAPISPSFYDRERKGSLHSNDERTLLQPSPTVQSSIAPWETEKKMDTLPATPQSDSFPPSANERQVSETVNQPFRHEVRPTFSQS